MKVREAVQQLTALGFVRDRTKGSHATYRHPDGRSITLVINHANADVSRIVGQNLKRVAAGGRPK